MKITGHKVTVVSVPYEGAITGSHVLLQLNTDEGIEGIGYVSRIRPPALKPLVSALDIYSARSKATTLWASRHCTVACSTAAVACPGSRSAPGA